MIKYFSNIEKALEFMAKAMKYSRIKLYLSWARYGINKAEYRVSTAVHIFKNSNYTLYQTEKEMIVKNVKPFNYYRQWTKNN